MPCAFQIPSILSVLPPPTIIASMLKIVCSKVSCEESAFRKVRNTKGRTGRSTQVLYHSTIPYGLSADAVGTKQIFGLAFPVRAAIYLMKALLSLDMLPDIQIMLSPGFFSIPVGFV